MIWLFIICALSVVFFFMRSTDFYDGRTAEEKMSDAWVMGFALIVAVTSGAAGVVWMIVKVALS